MSFTRHLVNDVGQYGSGTVHLVDGIGGEQPECFPATYNTSTENQVTWTNTTRMGDYTPSLSSTVDGDTVTSPLTITEQLGGKTLVLTTSCDLFKSKTVNVPLTYVPPPSATFKLSRNMTNYNSGMRRYTPYVNIGLLTSGTSTTLKMGYSDGNLTNDYMESYGSSYLNTAYGRLCTLTFYGTNTSSTATITCNGITRTYNCTAGSSDLIIERSDFDLTSTGSYLMRDIGLDVTFNIVT